MNYNTQNAASLLGISPKVLLIWSEQLAAVLSDAANDTHASQRHYTEADIALLQRAKGLISSGYSYEQVRSELSTQEPLRPTEPHPQGQTIASPAKDAASTARDTRTLPLERSQQPPQQPIDQLRDYLDRPQPAPDPTYVPVGLWRERFSRDVLPWLSLVVAVCVIAILVGVGIVFLTERPAFSNVGRNSSTPTTALTQVALRSGGVMPEGTLAPTQPPTPIEPAIAMPSGEAAQEPSIAPSSTDLAPTVGATSQPTFQPTAVPLQPTATAAQPLATAIVATVQPSQAATSSLSLTPNTAQPTDVAPSATILQRVAAAETALHSGQFEATIDHGGGNRSSAQVRFDTGSGQRPPAFEITSTYEGSSGAQTTQRITIGDRSWQRQPNGSWTEQAAQEGVVDQINVFLPHTEAVADAQIATEPNKYVLAWYDPSRDVDVTLSVDTSTGVPLQLRELTRSTGATLTVDYKGWNTAVEITPPK